MLQWLLIVGCIGRRFPSGKYLAWERQSKGEALEIADRGPLMFDDDAMMVQAALDGAGIAYVYEALVQNDLAARLLFKKFKRKERSVSAALPS